MVVYIKEGDRKYRKWKEIMKDFPMSHLALTDVDAANTMCPGGVVVAYAQDPTEDDMTELGIFIDEHSYLDTNTFPEEKVMF